MRLTRWIASVVLALGLVACGPPRKSVFPPAVSIQQLQVTPDGLWHLTVRIQNNSYDGMDFTSLEGTMQVAQLEPVRLHGSFKRDIPALSGDVVDIDVLPTPQMSSALAGVAAKGSAGSLAYRVSGTAHARPEQEKQARDFDFSGNDWLSPVPGIPGTFR